MCNSFFVVGQVHLAFVQFFPPAGERVGRDHVHSGALALRCQDEVGSFQPRFRETEVVFVASSAFLREQLNCLGQLVKSSS